MVTDLSKNSVMELRVCVGCDKYSLWPSSPQQHGKVVESIVIVTSCLDASKPSLTVHSNQQQGELVKPP